MKASISQKHYRNTLVLNLLNKFIAILLLLTVTCCQSNKTDDSNKQLLSQVEELQKTIDADLDQINRIHQEEIIKLKANVTFFDSVLASKGEEISSPARISLMTAGEYTKQFDTLFPVIIQDIQFSTQQLFDLHNDIKSKIYSNHEIISFLNSERNAVNLIHGKTKHLLDRLFAQNLLIETLEKKHQTKLE